MSLQKIAYQTTIIETNEVHDLMADDVIDMMHVLMFNMHLTESVHGRPLVLHSQFVNPITDELTINVNWGDDNTAYLKVVANKIPDLVN